jgi:hypothetical protein
MVRTAQRYKLDCSIRGLTQIFFCNECLSNPLNSVAIVARDDLVACGHCKRGPGKIFNAFSTISYEFICDDCFSKDSENAEIIWAPNRCYEPNCSNPPQVVDIIESELESAHISCKEHSREHTIIHLDIFKWNYITGNHIIRHIYEMTTYMYEYREISVETQAEYDKMYNILELGMTMIFRSLTYISRIGSNAASAFLAIYTTYANDYFHKLYLSISVYQSMIYYDRAIRMDYYGLPDIYYIGTIVNRTELIELALKNNTCHKLPMMELKLKDYLLVKYVSCMGRPTTTNIDDLFDQQVEYHIIHMYMTGELPAFIDKKELSRYLKAYLLDIRNMKARGTSDVNQAICAYIHKICSRKN